MLSLCCAVDDVVLCCIILHRILLTLDLVAAKTLVVFYVMVLCKYVTGPIVCPNLNISSVMVNKLNDWLGDGAGARHRPWLLTWPGAHHGPHLSPSTGLSPGQIVTGLISPSCSNTNSANPGRTSSASWTTPRTRRRWQRFRNTRKSRSREGKIRKRKVFTYNNLVSGLFLRLTHRIIITHPIDHHSSIMWAERSFVWRKQ